MLCDICKKNKATVHYSQIIDGKTKKVDVCEACSKEKGVDDPTGFSLADLLLGLGAAEEIAQTTGGAGELKCPHCGFTHADFKKSGRLGCAECYTTFAEGMESLPRTMHKGTRHVGKVPQALKQTQDLTDRLKGLEKRLEKAVAEEDFETAVNLRDEIRQIKARLTELAAAD
jgi:protein arginine kinase activator